MKPITYDEWELVNNYLDDRDAPVSLDATICGKIQQIESNKFYIRELTRNVSRERRRNEKLRREIVELVKEYNARKV
jgi:hypothetical protein